MKKLFKSRNTGLVVALIVLLIVARILTPNMFTVNSIISMLQNNSVYALLAVGEMMVILTGGIDISIGSTLAFSGVACTALSVANPNVPGFVWLLTGLGIGILCGLLNGVLVGYLHMVPMICTLGTMYIFRGLAFVASGGQWWFANQYNSSYRVFAITKVFGIPTLIFFAVVVMILAAIFLGYTSAGRRIYAIGTSKESSAVAGIKEAKVTLYAFVICGGLAGLAGMLYTGNYAVGYYGIGQGYEMIAIAICVLGGVSITGGKGRVDGVFIGVLIMSVITYFISMIPGMSVWQDAFEGAIIIIAVAINYFTERAATKQALRERGALI